MYLSEFTQIGEVKIQFSEILRSIDELEGFNLTMISNDFVFGVDYKTFVDGFEVGHEKVPKLLDWNIKHFEGQFITFKVNISNPVMVSTGDERDQLDITFKVPYLFKSATDERVL